MEQTTCNVRVYKTRVYKGKKVTTYYVRWKVADQEWQEPFRNAAQADSFRSALLTTARKGEASSTDTGRPVTWQRTANEMTWYEFACAYADMKWKSASAKYRMDIARALTAATPAMFGEERGSRPADAALRLALRRWAFNTKQREHAPGNVVAVLAWIARNTAPVSTLAIPANARRILDAATTSIDGRRAAASTARRHRTILANALDYARELKVIDVEANPVRALKWTHREPPRRSTGAASSTRDRHARCFPPSGFRNRAGPGSWRSSASCTTPGSGPRKQSASARTT